MIRDRLMAPTGRSGGDGVNKDPRHRPFYRVAVEVCAN